MVQLILIVHVLVAIALIALVLLQQGKGSTMGAGFGAGASGTVFGSTGAAPFLLKLTGGLAAIFFATSLSLSYFAAKSKAPVRVSQQISQTAPHKTAPKPS